jgi:hypothetical protein
MRTLGVDLASQAKKTAICEIEWRDRTATVSSVRVGVTDPEILDHARTLDLAGARVPYGDAIGIDAPFGWPQPFVELVTRQPTAFRRMPSWDSGFARSLCYRLTDRRVREELDLVPLSVACDKLAFSALRCAGLLDDLGVVDRSGVKGVFEVYPAAALKAWHFVGKGVKPGGLDPLNAKVKLATLLQEVRQACPWLSFSDNDEQLCSTNDDAFDALIASIAARAAALGLTIPPSTQEEVERARAEGWIAIPRNDVPISSLS